MKKIIKRFATVALAAMVLVTGCASQSSEENKRQNKDPNNTLNVDELTNKTFYVQSGKSLSTLYFGQGTFDAGNVSSSPSDSRVLWYKDNFSKIPTLYSGDSLIYFTKDDTDEKFTFERFSDEGYSIGLCKIKVTPSGRYSISTDQGDRNTYPNGDTDKIIDLGSDSVKRVILDTLGGLPIRTVQNNDNSENYSYLSKYGTIIGLEKDKTYEAQVYAGSIEHDFAFTANVKIMGSMEAYESHDYFFKQEYVMELKIPEWFNSGYYLVNGQGLFRYVKNGTEYDENTDFNVPNINPDEKNNNNNNNSNAASNGSANASTPNYTAADTTTNGSTESYSIRQESRASNEGSDAGIPLEEMPGFKTDTFNVRSPGWLTVTANALTPTSGGRENYSQIIGTVTSPSGVSHEMRPNGLSTLSASFNASETGTYTVTVGNLDDREMEITVE